VWFGGCSHRTRGIRVISGATQWWFFEPISTLASRSIAPASFADFMSVIMHISICSGRAVSSVAQSRRRTKVLSKLRAMWKTPLAWRRDTCMHIWNSSKSRERGREVKIGKNVFVVCTWMLSSHKTTARWSRAFVSTELLTRAGQASYQRSAHKLALGSKTTPSSPYTSPCRIYATKTARRLLVEGHLVPFHRSRG